MTSAAISAGQVWFHPLSVSQRSFLQAGIEQRSADLSLVLRGADGSEIFAADSPTGPTGEEELVAILEPGEFRLEVVVNGDAEDGGFRWLGARLEPATPAGQAYVEADRLHRRGWRLFRDEAAHERALECYRQALATWEEQDHPRRQASTLDGMAQAYLRKGQPQVAIALLDRAIEAGRDLESRHDRTRLVVFLNRAGASRFRYLGQAERAVGEYFDQAVAIAESLEGEGRVLAVALQHRGRARQQLGALQTALDDLRRASEVEAMGLSERFPFLVLKDMTGVLLSLNNAQEALLTAEKARDLAVARGSKLDALSARSLVAKAQAKRGDLAGAGAVAEEVVAELKAGAAESPTRRNHVLLARGLQALGEIRRKAEDMAAARELFEGAVELARQAADRQGEAVLLLELGNLDRLQGRPRAALARLQGAQAQLRQLGDQRHGVAALARTAEALRDLDRLDEAETTIAAALARVEELRAKTLREDVRREFFAFRQEYFDIALDIRLRSWLRQPSTEGAVRALELHDRRLSIELRDRWRQGTRGVAGGGRGGPGSGASKGAARERAVERQLADAARTVGRPHGQGPAEVDRLLRELSEVRSSAAASEHRRPAPTAIAVQELKEGHLEDGTLMLVYALGEERSILWALEPGKEVTLSVISASRARLRSLIAGWTEALISPDPKIRPDRERYGGQLTSYLLSPVAQRLKGKRLVIVGEGDLLSLPFAALPDPGGGGPYLIQQADISYLPSLALLPALRRVEEGRGREPRVVAAFVDPIFSPEDPRLGAHERQGPRQPLGHIRSQEAHRNFQRTNGGALARLEHSAAEGEALLQEAGVPGSLLATGGEASLQRLRSLDLTSLSILHLGTHAFVDPARPDLSGLVLSRYRSDGSPREGYLFGFEIAGMDLPADLVVLSACETARGRRVRGEGALGLSRRFFDAGAARVLSTHWQVSDQPTARLMTQFYDSLLEDGLSPSAALRKAQLALLSEPVTEAPYYWAGFRLEGDWRRPKGWEELSSGRFEAVSSRDENKGTENHE